MLTKFGYTGSRDGMDQQQANMLYFLLQSFRGSSHTPPKFMHGDCKGGDEEAHDIARLLGYYIIATPQNTLPEWRAYCEADEILEPKAPLDRNRDIVNWSQILFAAPPNHRRVRSGSWYTYNYAVEQGKRAWLL